MLSYVWFFATPWAIARQAPLSMGFLRQEYRSGLPFPPPGVFLTRDWTTFSALESGFWITRPPGKSLIWLSLILADCNTRRLRGQFLGRINMPPGWREPKGLRRQHRLPVEPKSLVLLKGRLDFSPQFLWIFHLYHFAANWQGYEPSPEHMSDKSLAPRWPGQSLF